MDKKTNKNYTLKSEAVDELLKAEKGETPRFSEEELKKYRSKSRFHIPEPVKILFLKAWFAGAVCYFILWGLGMYIASLIDMLFVLGVVLGMVTDILTNNVIRFIEPTPGANDKWLLFPKKGMGSFVFNILTCLVEMAAVFTLYSGINTLYAALTNQPEVVWLGVEPVLFGLFCMGFEMLLLLVKRTVSSIIADAKGKA